MSNIIQINNLNKSFGSVNAVQNLSFRVKKESCLPFLVSMGQEINYNQYYVWTTVERQWKRFY